MIVTSSSIPVVDTSSNIVLVVATGGNILLVATGSIYSGIRYFTPVVGTGSIYTLVIGIV